MDMPEYNRPTTISVLILGLALAGGAVSAAEIRGTVSVQQAGLFNAGGDGLKEFPVSVALYPAEDQLLPRRAPERHIVVLNGLINPLYLAVPRGDSLLFKSHDKVYHELFTHSRTRPLVLHLEREGVGSEATVTLDEVTTLHWFCRIHAKSYARVDVVDTPLVRMVRAGESFEFRDLQSGKWLMRVAAPGAETKTLEAEAVTAPPPVQVQLIVKGFSQGGVGVATPRAASIEQLFPNQPGL